MIIRNTSHHIHYSLTICTRELDLQDSDWVAFLRVLHQGIAVGLVGPRTHQFAALQLELCGANGLTDEAITAFVHSTSLDKTTPQTVPTDAALEERAGAAWLPVETVAMTTPSSSCEQLPPTYRRVQLRLSGPMLASSTALRLLSSHMN